MGQEDNIAIIDRAYKIWDETKGDSVDHWMSIMADDVVFNSLAQGADGVEFTRKSISKAEVAGYFEGLTGGWEMIHYTVDEYITEQDRVVMIGSTAWTNKVTGKIASTPKVDVIRMGDGKIIEFSEYYDTAALLAASQ